MLQFLDENQRRALDRMADPATSNVFIAWWAMGTGKTRLALAAFAMSDYTDCIVVCRRISFGDWLDEMELIGLEANVWFDDYSPENLRVLAPYKNKHPKRILFLSAGDLKNIPINFPKGQLLIVDELYLFSNPQSKRSKLLRQMSLFCSARIGLSGTIMPARDNMAIFGQLQALNAHQPLASGSTEFRAKFQCLSKGRFGKVFSNKPGSDKTISHLLADRTDTYFPKSRPTRRQILSVGKNVEQMGAIQSLKELYNLNDKSYKYALQIVHAINGISNGWWIDNESNLQHYKSSKLERLEALLDDLRSGQHRVVVWCAYHNDIARIRKELEPKFKFLEFTAKSSFSVEGWKDEIILATEANGASVNHFKHVKYAIYYSIDYKLLNLEQSMARHERKGSEHDGAHYYFLQTRGTYDVRTYALVNDSKLTEEDIIKQLSNEFKSL